MLSDTAPFLQRWDMQHTIARQVSSSGCGLHSGRNASLRLCPAPENYGIRFVRIDIESTPEIPALVEYVVGTYRSTTLAVQSIIGEVRVQTVEHILAALSGCGIDNCRVEIDADEVPIFDGSALPFVDMIEQAGIRQQRKQRRYCFLQEPVCYKHAHDSVEILARPSEKLTVTLEIEFTRVQELRKQRAELLDIRHFARSIAPARTFCLLSELAVLVKQGLARGGAIDNALVILDDDYRHEMNNLSHIKEIGQYFGLSEQAFISKTGYLNDTPLRYPDEPVRHKIVDFLGDIALVGMPIRAAIYVRRTGHKHNIEFARLLRRLCT